MLTANAKVSSLIISIMIFFSTYAIILGWKNPGFSTVQPNLPRYETPTTFNPLDSCHSCDHSSTDHVKQLQGQGLTMTELNRLLSIVVDIENLVGHIHRENDPDVKQVYFYLFKVQIHILNTISKLKHWKKIVSAMTLLLEMSSS